MINIIFVFSSSNSNPSGISNDDNTFIIKLIYKNFIRY